MNNNQLFDTHIKEQLSDYSPAVHPRNWENIAAKKEKRKPAGFWYTLLNRKNILVIMSVLIVAVSGAWLIIKNVTTINDNDQTTNDKIKTAANNNIAIAGNKDVALQSENLQTKILSITDQSINELKSTDKKDKLSGTPLTIKNVLARSSAEQEAELLNKKSIKISGNTKIKTVPGSLSNDENNEIDITENTLPVGGTLLGRLIYSAQKIEAGKKTAEQKLLHTSPYGFLPDCPSLEKNASGNKKYLEFYAGPDYAFRSLKDTGNSTYLQKRKESTSFTSAYSAGVRFTKVFKNSVSIRGGVNYSQINEKFTYKQGNLVQVTYIINANGDTTGSYVTTGTRYKTTHNKYRSIDIPIMVGYEIGNGKLHANINAGVVVNLYSWQKGEVLDTAFLPVNITTGKGSTPYGFKTNAGLGFMAAVSVYYKLTDKIHLVAEPYYRYNLSQMNKENLTIKQKYNSAGIKIGVRVDLK